jgi:hypothetical protein
MGTKICLTSFVGEGDDMKSLGCLRKFFQFLSTQAIFNDLYTWLTQDYFSNCYVLNSYHLEEVIDVVGSEEILYAKIQGLQHGEKPKDGNTYLLSASILEYHFLCVLCSHIEKFKHFKYL